MKFVHIADVHFDCPFVSLSVRDSLSDMRRLEQRDVFKKVINYIKENNVNYLFISGDLYENEYVKQSTITYINNLFLDIPETRIFISPGNHDPYLKNSYYAEFNFAPNVYIFKGKLECKELSDINVYGAGFQDFYCKDLNYSSLNVLQNDKPNILVMHASLEGGTEENREYNPVSYKRLDDLGMDYIALGHIHKPFFNDTKMQKIVYPGSLVSLGFDELGEHGMIAGEIDENRVLNYEFIKLDDTEFAIYEQNVDNIFANEELVECLNELKLDENKFFEIYLVGSRNFEINTNQIFKLITKPNILKIKDNTKSKYNLNEIQNEKNLRGLFVREMINKLNQVNLDNNVYSEEEIKRAIEIGLDALNLQ